MPTVYIKSNRPSKLEKHLNINSELYTDKFSIFPKDLIVKGSNNLEFYYRPIETNKKETFAVILQAYYQDYNVNIETEIVYNGTILLNDKTNQISITLSQPTFREQDFTVISPVTDTNDFLTPYYDTFDKTINQVLNQAGFTTNFISDYISSIIDFENNNDFKDDIEKITQYLNNFEKQTKNYFSNTKNYDKIFSNLAELIDNLVKEGEYKFSGTSQKIYIEPTRGAKDADILHFVNQSSATIIRFTDNAQFISSNYTFKTIDDKLGFSSQLSEIASKFTSLSISTPTLNKNPGVSVYYKNLDKIYDIICNVIGNFITNYVKSKYPNLSEFTGKRSGQNCINIYVR